MGIGLHESLVWMWGGGVQAEGSFSKRYLKYLAKKFLKKMQMRDFLRVVSTNKSTYELKYFNIQENEDEADVE